MIEHNKKAGVRHCDKLRKNKIPKKKRESGKEPRKGIRERKLRNQKGKAYRRVESKKEGIETS